MPAAPACPQCTLENTYVDGANWVCADCGHEWPVAAEAANDAATVVRDSNGNVLQAGDTVVVIKDLKVKGLSIPLKQGTGSAASAWSRTMPNTSKATRTRSRAWC